MFQVEPFVESLSQGPLLRKILASVLRVLAVVAAFTGLFFVLGFLGRIVDIISHNVPQALGFLVALTLVLAVFFIAVKVLLFRAKSILLQTAPDYPLVSIASLLLKAMGELLTLFTSSIGLIAGILIWFGGGYTGIPNLWQALIFPAPSFVQGLVLIIASQVYALLILTFFYLVAELLLMFRKIAVNTEK